MEDEKFVTDKHIATRNSFRTIGPIVLGVGILCLVIGMVEFFTLDFFEEPELFWLNFVGMPLIFVGAVLTGLGYQGKMAKYHSREIAPVAKDTFNYLADGTQEGVEKISRAVATGQSSVVQAKQCPSCSELNKMDANFCNECGHPI